MMPLSSRASDIVVEPNIAEPASAIRTRENRRPSPVDDPEIVALVGSIVTAVTSAEEGLTALELRVALNEKPDRLQRALASGLRSRRRGDGTRRMARA